ncbi:MAG: zf-HC2 domain-containing protein [Anaerolineales bacterium]|nr:zf-HC2 domain-containing protein [Anaerolineales bacterium]NUQ84827.1 zf-HC2 domain-containing protein [Anaerolineales bacterium]
MSDHVTEWLNAYYDGELKGGRLRQVEDHLAACEACRAELESLRGLSALLHEVPAMEFVSQERFVSQVNLRLFQRRSSPTKNRVVEVGWWMIPVGLLMAWVFFSTTALVSDMVAAAGNLGVLNGVSALPASDPSANAIWASTLGRIGLLEGESLKWVESTESFTRNVLPQFVWQVSIAMLYLSWIAIWWARQTRREQTPLLEG